MITAEDICKKCRGAHKIGLLNINHIYISDFVYCFTDDEVKHVSECRKCPCFKKEGEE